MRARPLPPVRRLLLLALLLVPALPCTAAEETLLAEGVALTPELAKGDTVWRARVDVPEDATRLSVALCSETNLDLYLRHGQPLGQDFVREAELAGRSDGPLEIVQIGADSPVPLRPGPWHLAVVHPQGADRAARFEIAALVDRGAHLQTLLPGEGAQRVLRSNAHGPELRTFLPSLARRLTIDLAGTDETSVRYLLTGPDEYRRSGRAPRRLVLHQGDSPAGVYTLDLDAAAGAALPETVQARIRWEFGTEQDAFEESRPVLTPGTSVTLTVGGEARPVSRTVRIPIPDGTGGFTIDATNRVRADVDLYVRRGRPLDMGDEDADYFALSSAPSERLVVGGLLPLRRGIYYCEVVLVEGKGPVRVTLTARTYAGDGLRGTWGAQDPPVLVPGRWTADRVEAGLAGVTWHAVEVPAGTRSLHAVLLGATAPLDLVLARRTDGSIMRRALTARVDERIDHVFRAPPDTPRRFLLGVMNRNPYERRVLYRVALGLNTPPALPPDLRWPPLLSTLGHKPWMRVAAATVELTVQGNAGGSGTCVTPRGRILTCRHVLEIDDVDRTIQREGILVAFPARLDAPPVQSFLARVAADSERDDLAFLELTSDVFGRPLAPDVDLPWVPLGDSGALDLGDPVMVFGYPSEGSERSRTPVILTRGTVSGLEASLGRPRWIKTDAWIGLGHSGGSLVDGRLRLVGIPAATLGQSEVLGLAIPVALVPPAWRQRIAAETGR